MAHPDRGDRRPMGGCPMSFRVCARARAQRARVERFARDRRALCARPYVMRTVRSRMGYAAAAIAAGTELGFRYGSSRVCARPRKNYLYYYYLKMCAVVCAVVCAVICAVGCVVVCLQTLCGRAFRCVVSCVVGCVVACAVSCVVASSGASAAAAGR